MLSTLLLFFIALASARGGGENEVESLYLGCYKDSSERILPFYRHDSDDLTPEMCVGICYSQGLHLAGVEYGKECHCGDEVEDSHKVNPSNCNVKCGGNDLLNCGGVWHLGLYTTGIEDYSNEMTYLGCYKDSGNARLLPEPKKDLMKTNSPSRCANICRSAGFIYSGVQYGYECFCGSSKPSPTRITSDSECRTRCPGDPSKLCGGTWRLQLYYTGLKNGNKRPPGSVIPTTEYYRPTTPEYTRPVTTPRTSRPTTPRTKRPTTSTCKKSLTILQVPGKACSGDVIFQDNFDKRQIDTNRWSHSVFMPWTPDYEFVVFTKSPQNSFISNGVLHIKPTIREESNVVAGVLDLHECTSETNPEECRREAISYSILPPVQSARLHTKETFAFRYGIIDIRAKLPRGEWIVPELWLEPARKAYGADYSSGRIRVAMARGNSRLSRSDGEESGANRLECGVLLGDREDIRQRSVVREHTEGWHTQFHNYTLIWRPENLIFLVDGEEREELVPEGGSIRMCDLLGFSEQASAKWRGGSPIAPCDKDFYLSFGVSVGGIRDFADDTTSETGPKPWKNTEVKALLKFWKAKSKWSSTWHSTDSALQIDSVTIRAL